MAKYIFTFTVAFLTSLSSGAGLLYNYSQLALKDLDQMSKIIQDKTKESKKEKGGDKIIPLKEAFQAVYSRPNEDGMIEKIVSPLKNNLNEMQMYEKVVQKLVSEAIGALSNTKPFSPVVQVTYWVFLENMVSEMKPQVDQPFESSVLTKIRDAKIELTPAAKKERLLRMMKQAKSPSELAGEILEDLQKRKAQEEAARKAEAGQK